MRILIVSQYFHPENFRVNQLALALKQAGHSVVMLTGQPNYPSGRFFPGHGFAGPAREQHLGIEIIRVPLLPRGAGGAVRLFLNYLTFVLIAVVLGLPRVRGRFDACIAFCPSPITSAIPAIVLRRFRKTPVALWLQDLWPETFFAVTKSRSRVLRAALDWLVRRIHAGVDQIWIQSRGYADSVRAHGGRAEQIRYVPNWAEDLYDCDAWNDLAAESVPANSLVFAGNLGRAQGLETLLSAAEMIRNATPSPHWVFVGDGSLRPWLRSEIQRRGLSGGAAVLPRRLPHEMPAILQPAAALLVTLGDDEVFAQTVPSKLQSSMAAGRPVIAAVSGETARLIEEAGCGYVCPPHDASALADTVGRFLRLSAPERAALGRNGHAFYKMHFTQARVMDVVLAHLREMALSLGFSS